MAAATQPRRQGQLARFFSDQRKWTPYVFLAPFFITFAVFTLYPMLPRRHHGLSGIGGL